MIEHRRLPSGTFAGRYELGRVLGQGGFATVVSAHDLNLRRDVALKVSTAVPGDARRWARELEMMSRVSQLALVHLPTLYDWGEHESFAFFAMALYGGGSLHRRLDARGPISVDHAVALLDGLADLDRVHAAGILHRDIKPDNLLYVEAFPAFFSFVLCDWGIAEHLDSDALTDVLHPVGTKRYMSPQRQEGMKATASDDQFAAGRTVEDALRGFVSEATANALGPVPRRLARVLDRATDPDPRGRYASMRDLADAFGAAAKPLLGARRSPTRTAATRMQEAAADSIGGLRRHLAALEDQLSAAGERERTAADERGRTGTNAGRRDARVSERTLAAMRTAQDAMARELAGVRRVLARMEAAIAEQDEVAEPVAAQQAVGGQVRGVFASAAGSLEVPGGGVVADFAEFARRRRAAAGERRHLSAVPAPAQRAQQLAGSVRAAARRVAPYAFKYGTVLALIAAVCGLATVWAVLSARLPVAVVGSLQLHTSIAGSLAWAAVDALMFAAVCRTTGAVLSGRAEAAGIGLCTVVGIVCLVVGYDAHRHTLSPWMLAPGQWYLVGVSLLTLGLLISYRVPAVVRGALLAAVAAVSIPMGTLILDLWILVGVAAVCAPFALVARTHRLRPPPSDAGPES